MNLTEAAFDRNIELGLLARDRTLAATTMLHFRTLIEQGLAAAPAVFVTMRERGHDGLSLLRWRARLNRCVRGFFEEAGFVEVETPLLAPWLIPEPSIDVFATEQRHAGGSSRPLWLTPSPELWMKRLVAAGLPAGVPVGALLPQRGGAGAVPPPRVHHAGVVRPPTRATARHWPAPSSSWPPCMAKSEVLGVRGAPATRPPLQQVSMARLWQDELGLDPAHTSAAELRAVARRLELPAAAGDTWEQLFNRIFLTCIEPRIARGPAGGGASTTRRGFRPWRQPHADGAHAMRWELYLAGIEVANCFQEETGEAALDALLEREARRQRAARVVPRPDRGLARAFAAAGCVLRGGGGRWTGSTRWLLGLPAIGPVMACAELF